MKRTYPVVIEDTGEKHLLVRVPDFDRMTQGKNLTEAIDMAQDLISMLGMDLQDKDQHLPVPSSILDIQLQFPATIVTLVNVDIEKYRKSVDARSVRKNVTIPGWLNAAGEDADLNFSAILQEGLKKELQLKA
jgi:predicted RNase H-like HicB family nuclease/post-segregation antitoxin (ccd killing protein)